MNRKSKGFTIIEMLLVVGIMGMIAGGLVFSMRRVIEEATFLKKMQKVEEEVTYITDVFAKDAQYSELQGLLTGSGYQIGEGLSDGIAFSLTEKKEDIEGSGGNLAEYYAKSESSGYYLYRRLSDREVKLNTVPFTSPPKYIINIDNNKEGTRSYLISISAIFNVETKFKGVQVPMQTSVTSRLFEL